MCFVIERKTNAAVFPALENMQHCLAFGYMTAKSCYATVVVRGFVLHLSGQRTAKTAFKFTTVQCDSWHYWCRPGFSPSLTSLSVLQLLTAVSGWQRLVPVTSATLMLKNGTTRPESSAGLSTGAWEWNRTIRNRAKSLLVHPSLFNTSGQVAMQCVASR